jgi:hypothetical protein
MSPMQQVIRELRRRGVPVDRLVALEVFGKDGDFHLKDYASSVGSVEIWELEPDYLPVLRHNFPESDVRIVDSFAQIKSTDHTFDLIVVDNPVCVYDGHCEHFDLIPDLFRIANNSVILIINVVPSFDADYLARNPHIFSEEQLKWRSTFYGTDSPDNVSIKLMVERYRQLAEEHGYGLVWHFAQRRDYVYYLVLSLQR